MLPAALLCLIAFVQDAPHPEIHGIVVDDNHQPLADVEVSASIVPGTGTMGQYAAEMKKDAVKTTTDVTGRFVFHPDQFGSYLVWVQKEGYLPPGDATTGMFTLTAKAPVHELHVVLTRTAEITGRVVDEDGNPLANFPVAAVKLTKLPGRSLNFRIPAVTDAEGKFRIPKLSSASYLMEISPRASGKERVLAKFSDEEAQTIDEDWEHSFWPGGHGEDTASPVALVSGAMVDFGRLTARKAHYYRVHLRLAPSNCKPAEKIALTEFIDSYQMDLRHEALGEIACGSDALIAGYAPGSYRLSLATGGDDPDTRATASIPLFVTNKNLEVTAALATGVALDVELSAADGARAPDYSRLYIGMEAIGAMAAAGARKPVHPGANGKLRITGVPPVNHWMQISGLDAAHVVKEIRYNGAAVGNVSFNGGSAHSLLPIESGAMIHSVSVVIDDKPAGLTGTVSDGDQPAGKPWLILAKWPPATTPFRIVSSIIAMGDESPEAWNAAVAWGDSKGQFQFAGLPAGEYRVVALRTPAEDQTRAPGTLERALAAAPKIDLSAGGFQNLTLTITELH